MSEKLKHIIYTKGDCIPEKTMFDYIDNLLSSREQHNVEKHLIDCEFCSDALEGLRLVKNRNKTSKINTSINRKLAVPEKKNKIVDIRFIMTAAAGLLLLIGGVFFFNQFISNSKENIAELKSTVTKERKSSESLTPQEESITTSETVETANDNETDLKEPDKKTPQKEPLEVGSKLLENKNEKGEGYLSTEIADEISVSEEEKNTSVNKDSDYNNEQAISANQNSIVSAPVMDKIVSKESNVRLDDTKANSGKAENNDGILAFEKRSVKGDEKSKNKYEKKKEEQKEPEQKPSSAANNTSDQSIETLKQTSDLESQMDSAITFTGTTEKIFSQVDQMPDFPGGETALQKYFNDKINTIENKDLLKVATLNIQFIINSKGKAINGKLVNPKNKTIEIQIIDAINNMPLWTPAKSNGEAVNILFDLPIKINIR